LLRFVLEDRLSFRLLCWIFKLCSIFVSFFFMFQSCRVFLIASHSNENKVTSIYITFVTHYDGNLPNTMLDHSIRHPLGVKCLNRVCNSHNFSRSQHRPKVTVSVQYRILSEKSIVVKRMWCRPRYRCRRRRRRIQKNISLMEEIRHGQRLRLAPRDAIQSLVQSLQL
jgi:hypothetical protein